MLLILVVLFFAPCGQTTKVQDSLAAAITVYRNPDFYGHIDSPSSQPGSGYDGYVYPGETTKPNPRPPTGFGVNYNPSPEFHHVPREVHRGSEGPRKGRGPYGHPRIEEEDERANRGRVKGRGPYEHPRNGPSEEEDEGANFEEEEGSNLEDEEDERERLEEEEDERESLEEEEDEKSNLEDEKGENENLDEEDEDHSHLEELARANNKEKERERTLFSEDPRKPGSSFDGIYPAIETPNYYLPGQEEVFLEKVIDQKKGTREYAKYHRDPTGENERLRVLHDEFTVNPYAHFLLHPTLPSNSKLVYKKVVPRHVKPVFLIKYKKKPRYHKFKLQFKPFRRFIRHIPDNSAYELNSELDSQYERII